MKTLILLLLLSSSVLYTGCHSKKMEKRKDIEISVINITTDQYPDEEIEIPIFIVYTFKVKNNKNTSIPFDFAWANFPREKEARSFALWDLWERFDRVCWKSGSCKSKKYRDSCK